MANLFQPVKPDVQLPELEESILSFWDRSKIFEKTLDPNRNSQKSKTYSFYDGPPFATGLPHYGHLLAGVLKDIVPRYWTMQGYTVPRRFGWDCHGLPVEYEINKAHKIESRKDILAMGVDTYNSACRSIRRMENHGPPRGPMGRHGRSLFYHGPHFHAERVVGL
jgi:isoleucyl-tRNA synthetase